MWGFITCLNDILIPHLRALFSLNYTQSMLIQFCFFGSYFIVSVPAGKLLSVLGYKKSIILGLLVASLGCLLFYPAAQLRVYGLFLFALFVLASGITLLQVAANPYVTALGKVERASSRLNMTQAFNAMGTTIAPLFGGLLILGVATSGTDTSTMNAVDLGVFEASQASAIQIPYVGLALAFAATAIIFSVLKLPELSFADKNQSSPVQIHDRGSAWGQRHLVLGAGAIFLYVGAEVSIGSFLVSFLAEGNIAALDESTAANYIAYYWGGAMIGRFIGAIVMRKIAAGKVLAFNAVVASALVATAMVSTGGVAMWAILLVGLFNSIMFPTIFSLALNNLGDLTGQGSGILCLAIVGGAIVPLLQGALADAMGIQLAFFLPALCYLYIAYYGVKGCSPSVHP
jgi:FHS family L-fucose permease-like MFS transporter